MKKKSPKKPLAGRRQRWFDDDRQGNDQVKKATLQEGGQRGGGRRAHLDEQQGHRAVEELVGVRDDEAPQPHRQRGLAFAGGAGQERPQLPPPGRGRPPWPGGRGGGGGGRSVTN